MRQETDQRWRRERDSLSSAADFVQLGVHLFKKSFFPVLLEVDRL